MNATAVERVTAPGQSGTLAGKQAGAQGPMSKAARDQAEAQLAEAQKAINALNQLLANPAQCLYKLKCPRTNRPSNPELEQETSRPK
jgi:hypothetical protein